MTAYIFSLLMAAVAYSLISTGIVLQKKGISWIGWTGKRDRIYYKHLSVWATGFLLMNIFGIPSAIALKSLPPHIVSAFAGWGIIVLLFLSKYFLKEKIFRSDLFYSGIVMSGIVLLNLTENISGTYKISDSILTIIYFLFPLFLFVISILFISGNRLKNIFYAFISGSTAGLMVISLKGLVKLYEYRIVEYPGSVYFYLYIIFALLSFISLQMSLKSGPVLITGQIQYSMTIVYPVAGTLIVFYGRTGLLQLISIGLIVTGVVKILKNR